MKKLCAISIAATIMCAPIIASAADQQQEIEELRKRVAALEESSDDTVEESRRVADPDVMQQYFGLGSGVYNQDLYIHVFGLNKDLNLLHQRRFLNAHGISLEETPRVLTSGYVFARAGHHSDKFDTTQHDAFIEAEAGIDFTAFINDYWLGYILIEAQGFGDDQSVAIDQGFTTYGNLDKFPVYATAGYFYPAFGDYTTMFIEDSLPQDLGRIRAPAVAVGYDQLVEGSWELSGSAFIYDGDTKTSSSYRLDEVGANIQAYKENLGPQNDMSLILGASVVNNVASSNNIKGFVSDDRLKHYVPAYDVRAGFRKAGFHLKAEYLAAWRSFSQSDFTQTKTGGSAKSIMPNAFQLEAGYRFDIWSVPSQFSVTYQQAEDTLAFEIPHEQYGASFQITPYRYVKVTFEYLQRKDYSKKYTTSNGKTGTGKNDDLFQGEVSVFF